MLNIRGIYFIHSLLVINFNGLTIIKLKNISIYWKRGEITIGFNIVIKVPAIITLRDKRILVIIYLIKGTVVPL